MLHDRSFTRAPTGELEDVELLDELLDEDEDDRLLINGGEVDDSDNDA